MKKLLALSSLLLGLSVSAFGANFIAGNITIGAIGSTVVVNQGANTVTFNPAAPANNAQVTFVNGDYSALSVGSSVVYSNFNYNGNPTNQLIWTHANATFTLTNFTLINEPGTGVYLEGTGIATLDGFDPTPGFWSFSASQAAPNSVFTFSSTNISPIPGVPDSGTTALLLGVGLMGLGVAARRMKR